MNAVSALIQVAFTAVLYFFLYRYLLIHLGVKQLGVWSLILSFSSIANLANLGLTSGLVKFVAEYIAEGKMEKLGKLILTSFIALVVLFIVVSLLVFLGAKSFIHLVIEPDYVNLALIILPYSLVNLCLTATSGVFTSVLEGYQKNYIRNGIYIVSGIVMYVATLILTPMFQLKGVAIAQLIQSIVVLLSSMFLVNRINPANRFCHWKWNSQTFKELFDYGYKFQAVSICQLLYEPTTKLLLSKFGGLALLGQYEMATKLVNQFRSMLVSANQVVIPVVAEKIKIQTKEMIHAFYARMNHIMMLVTFPLASVLLALTPMISQLWLGDRLPDFMYSMYVLVIASTINILCGPAYFSCMGEGRLSFLVFVHGIMAVLNMLLGYVLGLLFGGYGIILAWGLSLTIGSFILTIGYARKISIKWSLIFRQEERLLIFATLIISMVCILVGNLDVLQSNVYLNAGLCSILLLLYVPLFQKNRTIKDLWIRLRNDNR